MGLGDRLGSSLKKWATSKAEELLTADGDKRADASASASAASARARSDLGETLVRTAFPKLGEWADKQESAKAEREAAELAEEAAEIASLPMATVSLSITGSVTGSWSGQLHHSWNDISPNDADPVDPYADKPLVWFELFAEPGAEPDLGGMRLRHWSFQLPGYHGDGTYDLAAIAKERENAALEYLEWAMDFTNADDASFYFHTDSGPSSVTVSEGGRRLEASIAMSGALGEVVAVASISLG